MRLALRYILFAAIATGANFGVQAVWSHLFPHLFEPWLSLAAGTGVGLVVKYVLDKLFIFQADHLRETSQVARSFGLYSLSGGFLTLLFWGVELSFMHGFPGWPPARYVGGAIGLSIGYFIKYRLDRRFAFAPSASA